MKIKVEPGVVVRLDKRTSTSSQGGEYDISPLPAAEKKRILAIRGVSEVKPPPSKKDGDK